MYLDLENIDHSKTKAKSPQTNGICERFHKTILNEFYQITFRKKIYASIEMLQKDLDEWMQDYNVNRPHSGKYCYGKTPMKTFGDSLPLAKAKMLQYIDKIIFSTREQIRLAVNEFLEYWNRYRPHEGLGGKMIKPYPQNHDGELVEVSFLGGLLHGYKREKLAA